MSKAKLTAPTAQKEVTVVILPQFPKCDDSKVQRAKWIQDYDRVQSELLRNHLAEGATNQTATMSLRQLPADWEEQMRHQQAQKAQLEAIRQRAIEKKKKERGHSPPKPSHANDTSHGDHSSFYKSGPRGPADNLSTKNNQSYNRQAKDAAFTKARAATADLYSPSQKKFSAPKESTPARAQSRLLNISEIRSTSPHRPTTSSAPAYSRLSLSPMKIQESGVNESVTSTLAASRLPTTHECARMVNNILLPPASFKASVRPNLEYIDLRWISKYKSGDHVACGLTLDSMREDIFTAPAANNTALNSPRSVIVLLRNGCTVEDLQVRPMEYFRSGKNKTSTAHHSSSLALGPSSYSSEMNDELALLAHKHFEDRRSSLAAALRLEYHSLCREVSLLELLEEAFNLRNANRIDDDGATTGVTFLQARKDRLAIRQQIEMEQIAKQQESAEQLRRKVAENEEKRFLADLEHKKRMEAKREAAFARQREAEKRQEQLRQSTTKLQEEYQERLEERKHRLELKELKLQENRLAHREELRRIAQQTAAKREARISRQQELQEQLINSLQERRQQQEELEQERILKKEKDLQVHREQLLASQKLAQERREESKRTAAQLEEEIKEKAIEKAEQAAQRLQEFNARKRQQFAEQALEETKKSEQRKQTFEQAVQRQEERKSTFLAKRSAHDQRYMELETIRNHDIAKQQELERQEEDDKRLYVKRRTQAMQFDQLMSIGNIEQKKEKGEAVSRQRDKLVEHMLKEREKLRLQRERYNEDLYSKAVLNKV